MAYTKIGEVNYNGNPNCRLYVEYELVGQNISGNYSTVRCQLVGYNWSGGQGSYDNAPAGSYANIFVNGGQKGHVNNPPFNYLSQNVYKVFFTVTVDISHNASGQGSVTISGTHQPDPSIQIGGTSVSGSANLPSIPRQAKITSANDFTDEENPTMTFSNPGGVKVDARYQLGTLNVTRENIPNTGSYTFVLTEAERNALRSQIPNVNSGNFRYILDSLGYAEYVDRKMTLINAAPTFTAYTYGDINAATVALTGSNQKLIKGYSNIRATIATKAAGKKGATITKYQLKNGAKIAEVIEASGTRTVDINPVEAALISLSAVDSRGNATTLDKTAVFVDYFPTELHTMTLERATGGTGKAVTLSFNGKVFNATFGTVLNGITSIKYRYKKTGSTTWINGTTNITATLSGNTFSGRAVIAGDVIGGFNEADNYDIELTLTDKLSTAVKTVLLGSGRPVMKIKRDRVVFKDNVFVDQGSGEKSIFDLIYPVGSIYMAVNNVNPQTLFGGTWVSWGSGRVPTGVDTTQTEFNTVEKTGGAKAHALSKAEMPNVTGEITPHGSETGSNLWSPTGCFGGSAINATHYRQPTEPVSGAHSIGKIKFNNGGENKAHNNLPPYITCYMWKRTA